METACYELNASDFYYQTLLTYESREKVKNFIKSAQDFLVLDFNHRKL